jgi:Protein of unknown function (DUF2384)
MCPPAGHIVIEGQRFAESDEAMFLLASDILEGVGDDLEGLADSRSEARPERSARLGPIAEVMQLLESQMTHEKSLTWVVTPNKALGGRPLDLVTSGRARDVLEHIRSVR